MANTDAKWYMTDEENWAIVREMEKEIKQAYAFIPPARRGGQQKMTLNLREIDYGTGASIDQLVVAQAYLQVVAERIVTNGHEVPKDLQSTLDKCTRDLNDKLRAERQREIRAIKVQLEGLMSAEAKTQKLQERLAKLEELVK